MDAVSSQSSSTSVPLVVRVKRAADEEPLDVIRLLPPRSKIAKGQNNTFNLHNLEFKHAGTIEDKENLSSKTVELMDAKRPLAVIKEELKEEAQPKDAGVRESAEREGETNEVTKPAASLRRNHRMYAISKAFRSVSTLDLDDMLDPWTRFFTQEELHGTKSSVKRKLEDEAEPETAHKKSFILCDLESYGEHGVNANSRISDDQFTPSAITCNDEVLMEVPTKNESEYVYDIYTFDPSSVPNGSYDGVLTAMGDLDYILGTSSDSGIWNEVEIESEKLNNMEDEDEDSNDEDNWRNDYPEEEDGSEGSSDDSGSQTSDDEDEMNEINEMNSYRRYEDMYGLEHSYASRRRRRQVVESDESGSGSEEDDDD
ncbi:hypothetical protein RvY_13741 [Ramazzottius varieornatus]|uniref:Probable RNA polymerase II nuclear localization protein SLC7A6OS n=1 Tax=Ramazzottius varieornatus TaxID=947166 RepID=A0A1D1VNZ2_RAMVA|nr:hypothetical protein RvY_13741 [Ramazzottius varieornatus]